eukprot:CAMPEP_0115002960 /NCGR_PEP_ID=MMETSP0216-20121206/18311_1 /TAXON_ID=223996 /ORGANISM="Protocruzia adherens, Strain Boccale" /LENGTH=70 /DNA_ID=CAMNT_0002368643 /DNA_START=1 /DNA_END=210 /DNA_ORIENTATION=-
MSSTGSDNSKQAQEAGSFDQASSPYNSTVSRTTRHPSRSGRERIDDQASPNNSRNSGYEHDRMSGRTTPG